jgi:FAD synthase
MFEVHIFDFSTDIYDQEIDIYLLSEIRKNKQFQNTQELKIQLEKDKEYIQGLQHNILTFGSFDVVHKGHEYYLSEARKYGDHLITIIATDHNIERIK